MKPPPPLPPLIMISRPSHQFPPPPGRLFPRTVTDTDSDTIAIDWPEDWTLTAFARFSCISQTNDGDPRLLCPGLPLLPLFRRLDRMCDPDTQPLTGLHVVS
ncbi:hypothetical protein N7519_004444 [Penicillium mononematosum]|uniref:uncharacterized protein n=1 Tax=Penicillium mononematosum TaxID=268346 RepID=UPI0025485014|nr:uncharacterized protein N7519_004444 [Penicillium mononematosum]KAJ6189536.1 hypothetical protein N7519_004444 [Penicillium mononematosum]